MSSRGPFVLALACFGCSDARVYVAQPWDADQQLVVVVADREDRPRDPAPRVFAPGQVAKFELDAAETVRFYFRTYLSFAAGGPDLEGCGVAFGGAGAALPEAASSWVSDFVDLGGGLAIVPSVESAPRDLGLRFARCLAPAYPCEQIAVTRVEVDDYEDAYFTAVTAVADDLAFTAAAAVPADHVALGRIDGVVSNALGAAALMRNHPVGLAWDHADTIYGTTPTGSRFELSLAGEIVARYALTSTARGVSAGLDGAAIWFGETGVFEATRGATIATSLLSLPGVIEDAELVRRDRAIAVTKQAFYVFDGARWNIEYEARPSAFEKWDAVGGDEDVFVAADRNGQIIVREEAMRVWAQVPRPFEEGPRWRGVAGARGGKLIAVGDSGRIALWTGTDWCRAIDSGTTNVLKQVSVAPSGRVAYIVGQDDGNALGDQPVALRMTFPQ